MSDTPQHATSSQRLELTLCMGSACHQMGVYDVLPVLQRLLRDSNLPIEVELKGAFCLDACSDGVSARLGTRRFVNLRPQTVEQIFREQILPAIHQRAKVVLGGPQP